MKGALEDEGRADVLDDFKAGQVLRGRQIPAVAPKGIDLLQNRIGLVTGHVPLEQNPALALNVKDDAVGHWTARTAWIGVTEQKRLPLLRRDLQRDRWRRGVPARRPFNSRSRINHDLAT